MKFGLPAKISKHVFAVGCVAVLTIVAVLVLRLFKSSEGFADPDAPTLNLFYADWCPHCKTVAPAFKAWSDSNNGSMTVNGTTVFLKSYEEKQIPANMKSLVKGFPTVVLMMNGQPTEYSGPRDANGWTDFLNKTV